MAKTLDFLIAANFIFAVSIAASLMGISLPDWLSNEWIGFYLFLAFFILLESMSMSLFSTTPGKSILSIRVQSLNGGEPKFSQALKRNFKCQFFGNGFGFPFVSLAANIVAYFDLKSAGDSSWDRSAKTKMLHSPKLGLVRSVAIALATILLFGAFFVPQIAGIYF